MDDVKWMKEAIKQAKKAESYDEVPIGCVIHRIAGAIRCIQVAKAT